MAQFKNSEHLIQTKAPAFEKDWMPGQKVPNAGIYRCKTCGDEIVVHKDAAIPQIHHEHTVLGPVIWKLLVFAQKHPPRA
jgi:hypothetical protein